MKAASHISSPRSSGPSDPTASAKLDGPKGCTNLKLRQITRCVTQHYDAELARTGLKTTQYSLLSHVVKLEPLRAVDLAGVMRMSTSTLSRNLQPLIASGWIEVTAGDDARSRLIRATKTGHAKRTEAQRKWRVAQEGINATLGRERVLALHALIDESLKLLSPMEAHDDES
jgi:DNA-binding MarR family transcriptional regulator